MFRECSYNNSNRSYNGEISLKKKMTFVKAWFSYEFRKEYTTLRNCFKTYQCDIEDMPIPDIQKQWFCNIENVIKELDKKRLRPTDVVFIELYKVGKDESYIKIILRRDKNYARA